MAWSYHIQGKSWSVPKHMHGTIMRYLEHGLDPGSFMRAVLENHLALAVTCADAHNIDCLPAYAALCLNNFPSLAWGSCEKVEQWMNMSDEERQRNGQPYIDDLKASFSLYAEMGGS